MFVIASDNMLTATGKGMDIPLGKILNMHSRALPKSDTDPPEHEMLYTFTLDNKIQITLPHSRVFRQPAQPQVGP
jgi:hypothetical protein